MTTKPKDRISRDEETRAMLFEGISLSQLARLFRMEKNKVSALIGKLKASGERRGFPIYDLAEAASCLAQPTEEQLLKVIKRMPSHRLPVNLQKEFWDSRRSRLTYEENARDLWRTEDVANFLIDLLKTIRDSTSVFEDTVTRETDLTDKQRAIMQGLIDDFLLDVSEKIEKNEIFEKYTNALERFAEDGIDDSEVIEVEKPDGVEENDDDLDEDLGL